MFELENCELANTVTIGLTKECNSPRFATILPERQAFINKPLKRFPVKSFFKYSVLLTS